MAKLDKGQTRTSRIHRNIEVLNKIPEGQEFLQDLLAYCRHGLSPFVPGAPDVTNFNLGKQDVALLITRQCDSCLITQRIPTNE